MTKKENLKEKGQAKIFRVQMEKEGMLRTEISYRGKEKRRKLTEASQKSKETGDEVIALKS